MISIRRAVRQDKEVVQSRFTELVRRLGEGIDPELFSAAWSQLRALFRVELKKRGLWDSSPNYLGVYGWERWETAEGEARSDALDELVAEGYSFIFVTRIRSLKAQLEVKPNIDGLVLLNVRHFLHERQREHDPLGFQVFEIAHTAVRFAIDQGNLQVLAGDPKVRNDTLLGFDPATAPEEPAREAGPIVVRWNDDLMPDLVTAKGRDQEAVIDRLRKHLLALPDHGIRSFRFRSMLDPLKYDARARWITLFEADLAGQDLLPWRSRSPESAVASHDRFQQLTHHVSAAISTLEADAQTKTYLARLWHDLRQQVEDSGDDPGVEELISQRQIAQRLDIPRARLPELFGLLRRLVTRYQKIEGWPAASTPFRESSHER